MYRLIDCSTWDDPWFAELDPQGKLFFLYLITNRRSTSCGAFEVTIRQMVFETGLDADDINRWLLDWKPRIEWWPPYNIVWLRNFYRHQRISNEKTRTNARKIVGALPTHIQREIVKAYPELESPPDTLSIAYPSGMHQTAASTTKNNNKNNNSSSNTARARENPPPQDIQGIYEETLNGAMPTAVTKFASIDKQLTEGWLRAALLAAEVAVGPLSRSQLGQGIDLTVDQVRRASEAGKVHSPRAFAQKVLIDYLTEQKDGHHAA